jgi:hypothetical protein
VRWRIGISLIGLAFAACSTRQAVLPPPAPAAPPAPPPPAAAPAPDATRQAEENLERVDVSILQAGAPREGAPTPLPDRVSLRVRVVDAAGDPAAGVVIVLRAMSGGLERRATSGTDGDALFESLASGDYVVRTQPAEISELASIPLRLEATSPPDTLEIRLKAALPHQSGFEKTLSRPLVEA